MAGSARRIDTVAKDGESRKSLLGAAAVVHAVTIPPLLDRFLALRAAYLLRKNRNGHEARPDCSHYTSNGRSLIAKTVERGGSCPQFPQNRQSLES
jgi:hypothetical protein